MSAERPTIDIQTGAEQPGRSHPAVDALGQARRLASRGVRIGTGRLALGTRLVSSVLDATVSRAVSTLLAHADLTQAIHQHVDLDALVATVDVDAVAARVDVDAVAARIDLDAIIARIDLVGLATQVIDEIDLPEIIRESSAWVASDTVQGVRMQGIEADDAVGRVVDRLLRRRRDRAGGDRAAGPTSIASGASAAPGPATSGP